MAKRLYNLSAWCHKTTGLRARQLAKQPWCEMHLATGKHVVATIVDHKVPHKGEEALFFDPDNLQSLCKPCHDRHKQKQEASGVLVGCDLEGNPLETMDHWK